MFFCGALQAIAAVTWWTLDITGRHMHWHQPIAWTLPPSWAHAWLLLYGLFPFFIFGFLMTAGPNWLGAPKMQRSAFVPAAGLMAGGIVAVYAGLATSRALVAAGTLAHLAGWIWGVAALGAVAARHWNQNARYAIVIFTFVAIGVIGAGTFSAAVAVGSYTHVHFALHGAVWFFLLPIFAGVSTRMVPFFSSRILGPQVDYRPSWARPALMGGVVAHGAIQLLGSQSFLWIVDLPLAALIVYLALRWGLGRHGSVRLLAMLHIPLVVLACAFALYGVLSVVVASGDMAAVGLAPLHLLVIGYFSSTVIGMVSRVSLGHSGRPLAADTLTWTCYIGMIVCAVVRAGTEFAPTAETASALMLAAAAIWLAGFGVWAWRYVPMYLHPRVDAAQ
jgi:uncharacterized protein involved in response to NO